MLAKTDVCDVVMTGDVRMMTCEMRCLARSVPVLVLAK